MLKWLRRADRDLVQIEEYISEDNPAAALEMLLTIIKAVERLELFPGIGRAGRIEGTKELVIDGTPYIVPYRIKGSTIEILRVYHSSRKWFDRI